MDDDPKDQRIHDLQEQVQGMRRGLMVVGYIVLVVSVFMVGRELQTTEVVYGQFGPQEVAVRDFEQFNGWAQLVVIATGIGWIGTLFGAVDFFGKEHRYLALLGLLSSATAGIYAV